MAQEMERSSKLADLRNDAEELAALKALTGFLVYAEDSRPDKESTVLGLDPAERRVDVGHKIIDLRMDYDRAEGRLISELYPSRGA